MTSISSVFLPATYAVIMANDRKEFCSVCERKVPSNARTLRCDCCLSFIHKNCTTLLKDDLKEIFQLKRPWSCFKCNEQNLAFNHLHDEVEFIDIISLNDISGSGITRLSDEIFSPYDLNDDDINTAEYDSDINPDANFFCQQPELSNIDSKYYLEDDFLKYVSHLSETSKQCISSIHLNIRSMNANIASFQAYLSNIKFEFNFIGLSETWLKEDHDIHSIPGYASVNNIRKTRQGGGVSLLIQDNIPYKVRTDLTFMQDDIETVFVEATSAKKVLVGVVYRPPGRSIDDFNEHMKNIFELISNSHLPCYLMGDININLLNHALHKHTGDYLDLVYSNGFIPLINRPTRVTDQSATLIDHILTNNFVGTNMYQGVLLSDITDHYPIFCITHDITSDCPENDYIVFRNMKEDNYTAFQRSISETDWSSIINDSTCERSFSKFHEKIKLCYNECFPLKRIKRNYSNRIPWLTDDLKAAIKIKNKLYVKSKKHDTAFNKMQYSSYKSDLDKSLRLREKEYYNKLIESNKSNMKKTWDVIKTVINKKKRSAKYSEFLVDGSLTDDPCIIADKFNEYFCNIGTNLAKKIPSGGVSFREFLKQDYANSLLLRTIEEEEIKKIILSLKDGAPGTDDVSAKALKSTVDSIIVPLLHVCRLSFTEGHFPKDLKVAKIVPLHKGNDPSLFNNYRPISLLSVFSKILEKLMYERLYDYLTMKQILYEYQFGFQKNKSTYMALISLTDEITRAMENGDVCIGVFIDFRKAFDTVDHNILLEKLYHYGVRDVAYNWLHSYLTERQQFVEFGGVKSKVVNVPCGVPQGSNLELFLFSTYI